MKKCLFCILSLIMACSVALISMGAAKTDGDFIKWVDFNPKAGLLKQLYKLDKESVNEEIRFDFVDILSYIACKNGNRFNDKQDKATLNKLVTKLKNGEKLEDMVKENKYYSYYHTAYSAIFREFIGWYTVNGGAPEYGLMAYSPIAAGYGYADSDDFGNSRSYGFRRRHLGHDMFGSTGTPITAVEGGIVTEFGWNRYGGWRIGVRSNDNQRYYYYAHLRKNKPYAPGLEKGSKVEAGQVIGYMGATGYSMKENVNMNTKPHLHFGIQLIFDKSQEDGNGEIWIDPYQLVRFLSTNRAKTVKNEDGWMDSVDLKTKVPF